MSRPPAPLFSRADRQRALRSLIPAEKLVEVQMYAALTGRVPVVDPKTGEVTHKEEREITPEEQLRAGEYLINKVVGAMAPEKEAPSVEDLKDAQLSNDTLKSLSNDELRRLAGPILQEVGARVGTRKAAAPSTSPAAISDDNESVVIVDDADAPE